MSAKPRSGMKRITDSRARLRASKTGRSSLRRPSYPYIEALEYYCPDEWKTLHALRTNNQTDDWEAAEQLALAAGATLAGEGPREFLAVRSATHEAFHSLLRKGTVIATGHDSALPVSAEPAEIPPRAWEYLRPDFPRSCAERPGALIVGLRFTLAGTPRSVARIATEQWVRGLVASAEQPRTKDQAMREASKRLGRDFLRAAFIDAWRRYAPASWKIGGPKTPNERSADEKNS